MSPRRRGCRIDALLCPDPKVRPGSVFHASRPLQERPVTTAPAVEGEENTTSRVKVAVSLTPGRSSHVSSQTDTSTDSTNLSGQYT